MHSQKISAIIPCFNEEQNIERAIRSVLWADEILIVDSFSTDATLDIARNYKCRILQHEYINSATQKNWAIPQASHEWIFLLDADEECPEKLRDEMRKLLEEGTSHSAFKIYRQNFFMGKKIRFCGWQNDSVIRLFRRDNCRYQDLNVHAEIVSEGTTGTLSHKMYHYTYNGYYNYARKYEKYTTWSAKDRLKKTNKVTFFHLMVKPSFRFFKQYFLKLGILDGKVGFIVCAMAAYSVFLRYLKAWRILENEKL
jgi:glycosyltransferase involved in cell wall biosynthesis